MFGRIGENSNVGRIRERNSKFIKKETKILMFGEGKKNYVSKNTARIPRCIGIGTQFQCL